MFNDEDTKPDVEEPAKAEVKESSPVKSPVRTAPAKGPVWKKGKDGRIVAS